MANNFVHVRGNRSVSDSIRGSSGSEDRELAVPNAFIPLRETTRDRPEAKKRREAKMKEQEAKEKREAEYRARENKNGPDESRSK